MWHKIGLDQDELLKPHPLESLCVLEENSLTLLKHINIKTMTTLLDAYMDGFIGLNQAIMKQDLIHFTWAVLHGIQTMFPSPGLGDNPNDDPILVKKLKQGDGLLGHAEGNTWPAL